MKLIFLGSGSAFTVGNNNYQSNMILQNDEGKSLLIDCGTDARHSLQELGYTYRDITDVFISHLHADHMGGLEWLGFTRRFDESCDRPNLYLSELISKTIWDKCLSGTMSSIEGEICTLETYYNVHSIARNSFFEWEKIKFHLVQTVHIMHGFALASCHGLFFTVNGKNIYITADTQFVPHLLTHVFEQADIIFHDCETSPIASGVHPQYDELVTLPESTRNKMWLYHYNPGPLPNAEADEFLGFVKKGQVFAF